ncbi:MAG: single-stranded-DNA-specific exonuclease RecJ [Clostridia bacterium]|nr:single-stranded-DNA-specific exonuclease RecJ [Clostridia bacterium]
MLRFVQKEMGEAPPELLEMGLTPRLAQMLAARGVDTPEAANAFLSPALTDLHDPFLMQDMDTAVACVEEALDRGQRIAIFGDYDVDGVAATAILLTYLRKRGGKVSFYIPARHGEGYGLSLAAVERIAQEADLMITVDCGITSAKEVARAMELGMRVIVTDHHQMGEIPVDCEAVLSPLIGGYPYPKLCGAGVALKLVQAMGGLEAIGPLLDLAALATVSDLVPLTGENRVLVSEGLIALRRAERPGIRALMEVAGVKANELTAGQVGYQLAPRINAGGRLHDAARGVELLITRDANNAARIAKELDAENKERQLVEQHMLEEAEALLPQEIDFLRDRVIVLCKEGWNPGVIGLVASRLVERYHWPVILLAREGDLCVGSARSIPGINIHAALWGCRDLFLRFGGHAQAAGLTMQVGSIEALRAHLNAAVAAQALPDTFVPTEYYDFELSLAEVGEALIADLSRLQPTGIGNPAPVFCVRGAAPMEARAVGREGAHLKLYLTQEGEVRESIAFRMGPMAGELPERMDALFAASINVWQDRRTVQCEIRRLLPNAAPRAFLDNCARQEIGFLRAICAQILYNCNTDAPYVHMLNTDALDQAIRSAVEADAQGTLLVAHTLSGLRKWMVRLALMRAGFQYHLGLPKDPRGFNALCAAPAFVDVTTPVQYARIVLLDGAVNEGELAAWRGLYPQAEILCDSSAKSPISAALAPHVPDDELMRRVYKALRSGPASLTVLAQEAGCTEPAACVALCVLQELGLAEWNLAPWRAVLPPPQKSNLEDSVLLQVLREMAG